jgi:hypothetical protein
MPGPHTVNGDYEEHGEQDKPRSPLTRLGPDAYVSEDSSSHNADNEHDGEHRLSYRPAQSTEVSSHGYEGQNYQQNSDSSEYKPSAQTFTYLVYVLALFKANLEIERKPPLLYWRVF